MEARAFVRTHRSCIANAHRVVGIRRFVLDMDDGSECPIVQHRYLDVAEAVERAAEKKIPGVDAEKRVKMSTPP